MRPSPPQALPHDADEAAAKDADVHREQCLRAFEQHAAYVHRSLRRYGVRPSDTEDLVQDVFMAMWRSWRQFDAQRPLQPWLAGIAFRVARNHLRRKWREIPDDAVDAADRAVPGDERVAAAQAQALVLQVLAQLPEKYRLPLVLHELDEVPVNEVATLLRLPRATVYTRLRRARQAFAKLIAERHERHTGVLVALSPTELLVLERSAPPPFARKAEAVARAHRAAARGTPPAPPPRGWLPPWLRLPALGLALGAAGALVFVAVRRPSDARASLLASNPQAVVTDDGAAAPPARLQRRHTAPSFITALALPPAPPASATPGLPTLGLAGHWSFDAPAGELVAPDESGLARDCLLHDAEKGTARTWIAGPRGGAADLRAVGWLECPLPPTSSDAPVAMTVAAWVKMRHLPGIYTAIATRQIESSYKDLFFFGVVGGKLRASSHAWGGIAEWETPLERGRWYHTAFTHGLDGVTIVYVDGVEVARAIGPHRPLGRVTAPLTIGAGQFARQPNLVRQRLPAVVDEVRIYDRVLAPEELQQLASQPAQ
jgi:RNA polymerase sigma-70 factor (ECF subfamily)